MQKKNFWHQVLAFGISIMLIACGQGASDNSLPEKEKKSEKAVSKSSQKDDDEDDEEYNVMLPSPLQIASIFKRSGLSYQPGITAPVEKVSEFTSQFTKALAFGVYSADLSYAVLNDQPQEARNYIKAVKQLSDELGMGSIFSTESLFQSFERNIGNEDSMLYILATIQEQMDNHLENNNEEYKSAIFFAGAWMEGMYIGTKAADVKDNSRLSRRIVEQMTILNNIIRGLKMGPDQGTDATRLIKDLQGIYAIFENTAMMQSAEHPDEVDFEQMTITDDEMKELSSKIEEVRNNIINV